MGVSKQLLAIYNKPMVYYPLSTLMLADIRDILLISTPEDLPSFKRLLGDGSRYGLRLSYAEQASPNGIAEAFLIGEEFIADDTVALILGDNIFYGAHLQTILQRTTLRTTGATVFGYYVSDPRQFGIVEFDEQGRVVSLEEKPEKPRSNYAVTGLYFYDNNVVEITKRIAPSKRGELEITSVNQEYLRRNGFHVERLGRGYAWLDTGTHESMLAAANFIHALESRQGLQIACLEEIAFRKEWISAYELRHYVAAMGKSSYAEYLSQILEETIRS
jgi:glucose-1-phosphate thymidylyltransferase